MAFFVYFAIVLVSISGILLELDWLTEPKLERPVPVAQSTPPVPRSSAPRPIAKSEKAKSEEAKSEEAKSKNTKPAGAQSEGAKAGLGPVALEKPETTGKAIAAASVTAAAPPPAAASAPAVPAPAPSVQANNTPAPTTAGIATGQDPASAPSAQSVAAPKGRCDVQACAASYRSFRAEDCTYQPLQGERRLCTKRGSAVARAPPNEPSAARTSYYQRDANRTPARSDRAVELRRVERTLRLPPPDADDIDPPRPPGSIPMIERDDRPWP